MGDRLGTLKPQPLWDIFEEMSARPRPSKKEEAVVEYVLEFCETNALDYQRDEAGNIIIKVPATPGFEDKKTVVLQGHLDMVCEKNSDVEFDFDIVIFRERFQVLLEGDTKTSQLKLYLPVHQVNELL